MTAPLQGREIPEDIIKILKGMRRNNLGEYTKADKITIASLNKAGQSSRDIASHLTIDKNKVLFITAEVFAKDIPNAMSREEADKYSYRNGSSTKLFDVRTRAQIAQLNIHGKHTIITIMKHFGMTKAAVESAINEYRHNYYNYIHVLHGLKKIEYKKERG